MSFASSKKWTAASTASDAAIPTAHLHVVPRQRALPGPRAVVGGVLVAVAAIGAYAVSAGLLDGDTRSVVVVDHDLPAGSRLTPDDLRVIQASVDRTTGRNIASSPTQVEGATLLGPMKAGEIVQSGSVLAAGSSSGRPEVSFALPRSRAVGGELRSGELVDVVVSTKNDDSQPARTAVAGAKVMKLDKGSNGSLASSGDVVVTLSVVDRSQATAVATAVDSGEVTLVRITGVDDPS